MDNLDAFERDMLLEAAIITAGKTIKAIGTIIGQRATISVPRMEFTGIEQLADHMGRPDELKTTVLIRIEGEARGAVVLLVNPDDLNQLLANVDEHLRVSALEEMTNVVAGSALGSLSKFLGILFLQSTPASTTDMLRAIVNEVAGELGEKTAKVLSLVTTIQIGPKKTPASLYLFFDTETTANIIAAGKKVAKK